MASRRYINGCMASRRSRGYFPWADRWKAAVRWGGTRATQKKVIAI